MYGQEKITPYNKEEAKGTQVEQMFDAVAHSYDLLNHRLSFWIDKYWRNYAIKKLARKKPGSILDIATGTGDLAILEAQKTGARSVVGADISEGMMQIGREKVKARGLQQTISFRNEDCMNLSFADNSFDAVTAAFGIRNFQDLEAGLREMHRVLKKDGMLCVIELTRPVHFPIKQLFTIYTHTILPVYGRLISKDKSAYRYLIATIEAFPQGETMVEILKRTGFAKASFKRLTFGICTCYTATK